MLFTSIETASASPIDDVINNIKNIIYSNPFKLLSVMGGVETVNGYTINYIQGAVSTPTNAYFVVPDPEYKSYDYTPEGLEQARNRARLLSSIISADELYKCMESPSCNALGLIGIILSECPEWSNIVPLTVAMINEPKIIGDVNGDGAINSIDALAIGQAVPPSCTLKLVGVQLKAADAVGDGKVTYLDALFVNQYTINVLTDPKAKSRIGTLISSPAGTGTPYLSPCLTGYVYVPSTDTCVKIQTSPLPAFEAIFAIAGLMITAYIILRRKS